ncbi:uncharacterized protein G2W53_043217 [Senna tora]|uniref:Uncharacterized protein n=1 Tax=Senna tora TaxID=362788 RepID=A0A834SIA4_9FABA|nr:uncharacterized protein G2W53_043217 [Senna tora]
MAQTMTKTMQPHYTAFGYPLSSPTVMKFVIMVGFLIAIFQVSSLIVTGFEAYSVNQLGFILRLSNLLSLGVIGVERSFAGVCFFIVFAFTIFCQCHYIRHINIYSKILQVEHSYLAVSGKAARRGFLRILMVVEAPYWEVASSFD